MSLGWLLLSLWVTPLGWPAEAVQVAQSAHFSVTYEAGQAEDRVEHLLEVLEEEFRRLERELRYTPARPIHVRVYASTARFVQATGRPWWVAALAHQERIDTQPLETLRQRGVFRSTLAHELAHVFINGLSNGRCPLWLNEALAVYFAGEGEALLRKYGNLLQDTGGVEAEKLEAGLHQARDQAAFEKQYLKAYLLLQSLINSHGLEKLVEGLKRLGR